MLLTVGEAGDPDALEPLPANVHVERWWPQNEVMPPHVEAMIGHGGFGTTLAGLAAGVPMVVVPLFADQPFNARRAEAVGAGLAVHGGPRGLHAVPAALERVLNERSYADTARRIAGDIERLPPVARAVPRLEALAT